MKKLSRLFVRSGRGAKELRTRGKIGVPSSKRPKSTSVTQQNVKKQIGVWDLGAYVAHFAKILDKWNRCQKQYRFERAVINVPHQLIIGGDRTKNAALEYLGEDRVREESKALSNNLFVDAISSIASEIRISGNYEQVALVTPYMLAFLENNRFHYNYYAVTLSRSIFVSAYEMREFAARAKRPFEAAIGAVLLAEVLATSYPQLTFHTETRGCLFDKNVERRTVVTKFKKMRIESSCLELIPSSLRETAERMTKVLRDYRRE
jgi:hypothetical protein